MSDPTLLSYWFPLVRAAGLPVPKTEIVAQGVSSDALFDFIGEDPRSPESPAKVNALIWAVQDAGDRLGWPCFLRTGLFSGKHGWKSTCCVRTADVVAGHIAEIFTDSQCVDMWGLDSSEWVVREMLKTRALFYAFYGQMPITRERRYFVRDGEIVWRQPYWPPYSIEGHNPSVENWREILEADNARMPQEDEELSALSLRVSAAVPGYWSVDWLWTMDRGWVLTDMAVGDQSFRWDPAAPVEPEPKVDLEKYFDKEEPRG